MTAKRDLKRRIRQRQARTGESYTAALHHVRDQRPGAVPVVELIDVTEVAAALGIKCIVRVEPRLAERIDAAAVLRQLCSALLATASNPAFELMRSVVLRGKSPQARQDFHETWQFMERVRAGIGGISDGGTLLALTIDSSRATEIVVFRLQVGAVPRMPFVHRPPALYLTDANSNIYTLGDLRLQTR
jgi:hypothetical protein